MTKDKAHALVKSIIDTHVEAVRGLDDPARVQDALRNAKSDLDGLINEIYEDAGVGDDGIPGTQDDDIVAIMDAVREE